MHALGIQDYQQIMTSYSQSIVCYAEPYMNYYAAAMHDRVLIYPMQINLVEATKYNIPDVKQIQIANVIEKNATNKVAVVNIVVRNEKNELIYANCQNLLKAKQLIIAENVSIFHVHYPHVVYVCNLEIFVYNLEHSHEEQKKNRRPITSTRHKMDIICWQPTTDKQGATRFATYCNYTQTITVYNTTDFAICSLKVEDVLGMQYSPIGGLLLVRGKYFWKVFRLGTMFADLGNINLQMPSKKEWNARLQELASSSNN